MNILVIKKTLSNSRLRRGECRVVVIVVVEEGGRFLTDGGTGGSGAMARRCERRFRFRFISPIIVIFVVVVIVIVGWRPSGRRRKC